jgi:hypothetical protein
MRRPDADLEEKREPRVTGAPSARRQRYEVINARLDIGRDREAVIGVAPCEQARSIRSGTFDQHQCGKRREEGGALSVCAFVPETELRKNVRGRLMPAAVKLECAR